jgi:hypothetical protein
MNFLFASILFVSSIWGAAVDVTQDDFVAAIRSKWGPVVAIDTFLGRFPDAPAEPAWRISNATGTICTVEGNMCLTVIPGMRADWGQDTITLTQVEHPDQITPYMRWDVIPQGDGEHYRIRSRASASPVLGLDADSNEGGGMMMWPANLSDHQLFTFPGARPAAADAAGHAGVAAAPVPAPAAQAPAPAAAPVLQGPPAPAQVARLESAWGRVGYKRDFSAVVRQRAETPDADFRWVITPADGSICAIEDDHVCLTYFPGAPIRSLRLVRYAQYPLPAEASFDFVPAPGGFKIRSRARPDLFMDADSVAHGSMMMVKESNAPRQLFGRDDIGTHQDYIKLTGKYY